MNIVLLWWLCTCVLSLTVTTVNITGGVFSPLFNYTDDHHRSDIPFIKHQSINYSHTFFMNNQTSSNNASNARSGPRQGIIIVPVAVGGGIAAGIAVAVTVAVVTVVVITVVSFLTWYFWPQISYALHTTGHYIYCHVWKHCSVNGTQSLSLDIGDNYMVSTVSTLVYCRLWTQCGEQWSVHVGDTIWAIGNTVYCRVWVHCPDNSTGVTPSSLHMAETIWWAGHDGLYCHLWAHCPNTTWTMHVGTTLFCRLWKHCDDENGTAGYSLHVEETMHKVKCKLWPWAHCNDTTNGTLVGSVMGLGAGALGALGALISWTYCKLGGHCGGNPNIGNGTISNFSIWGFNTNGEWTGIDSTFTLSNANGPINQTSMEIDDFESTGPMGTVHAIENDEDAVSAENGEESVFTLDGYSQIVITVP